MVFYNLGFYGQESQEYESLCRQIYVQVVKNLLPNVPSRKVEKWLGFYSLDKGRFSHKNMKVFAGKYIRMQKKKLKVDVWEMVRKT